MVKNKIKYAKKDILRLKRTRQGILWDILMIFNCSM